MAQQQQSRKKATSLDALDGVTAFLCFVLGVFFLLTVAQNTSNFKPGSSPTDRFVTLGIGGLAVCFWVACGATLFRARRLAGGAQVLVALGLFAFGVYVGYSLVMGWGAYVSIPWSGIMVVVALLGLAALLGWFARRTLKTL